jgi:hypothetical protein
VDLLFLVDDPKVGGVAVELSIVRQCPELFEPLFKTENVYLYRLRAQ